MPTPKEYQQAIAERDSRITELLLEPQKLKEDHKEEIEERNKAYNQLHEELKKQREGSSSDLVNEINDLKRRAEYLNDRRRISDILPMLLLGTKLAGNNKQFLRQIQSLVPGIEGMVERLKQAELVDEVVSMVASGGQEEDDSSSSN